MREDEHSPWPGNACDPRRSLLCEPVVVPHCTFRWLGSIICRTPSLANHSRPSGDVEATDWNVAWAGWALSNTSNVLTLIFVSGIPTILHFSIRNCDESTLGGEPNRTATVYHNCICPIAGKGIARVQGLHLPILPAEKSLLGCAPHRPVGINHKAQDRASVPTMIKEDLSNRPSR